MPREVVIRRRFEPVYMPVTPVDLETGYRPGDYIKAVLCGICVTMFFIVLVVVAMLCVYSVAGVL